MQNLKSYLLSLSSAICFMTFAGNSLAVDKANMYLSSDRNCPVNSPAISDGQRLETPLALRAPTVDEAIKKSSEEAVRNGYAPLGSDKLQGNTLLCIKKDLWHPGGESPLSSDHVTVYVYQGNVYSRTCHVFPDRQAGKDFYNTTCTKKVN